MYRQLGKGRWRLPTCVVGGVAVSVLQQSNYRRAHSLGLAILPDSGGRAAPASRYLSPPNANFVKDVSQGSIYGFGCGLVVGFFSQALTLLAGLTMFTLHILQRWGLDIPGLLGVKEKLSNAVLNRPMGHAVFRLTFAVTFTLAAFVRF
ncbi:FUN14 family protein [Plectosphaerella plurivora]|uniref:FUN14 family protein n=1 Tax=Plectosphaerella plurivora TaxID=936078 RepID=A0A9P8V3L3_9PEZI|nr:FUN14 family protein [Plectosphaerella plurivora]